MDFAVVPVLALLVLLIPTVKIHDPVEPAPKREWNAGAVRVRSAPTARASMIRIVHEMNAATPRSPRVATVVPVRSAAMNAEAQPIAQVIAWGTV